MKVLIALTRVLLIVGVTGASILFMIWAFASLFAVTRSSILAFLPIPAIGFLAIFVSTIVLNFRSEAHAVPQS